MQDEGGKQPQRVAEKAVRRFSPVSTDQTPRQSQGREILQVPPMNRRGAPQRAEAVPPGTKQPDSRERTSERMRIGGWNAPPGAAERDAEEGRAGGMRGLPQTTGGEGKTALARGVPQAPTVGSRAAIALLPGPRSNPAILPTLFSFSLSGNGLERPAGSLEERARSGRGDRCPSPVSHPRQLTCNGSSKIPKHLQGGAIASSGQTASSGPLSRTGRGVKRRHTLCIAKRVRDGAIPTSQLSAEWGAGQGLVSGNRRKRNERT